MTIWSCVVNMQVTDEQTDGQTEKQTDTGKNNFPCQKGG